MKKTKFEFMVIAAVVLGIILRIYSDVKLEMIVNTDGRTVESADVIYDELGIDVSMIEKIGFVSGVKYSIIDDKIGQVRFRYRGRKYYLQTTKEQLRFEEINGTKSKSWCGTTLSSEDGEYLTGIEWMDLEGGGGVVVWRWYGIRFFLISSKSAMSIGSPYNIITDCTYYQPAFEQQTTEE